MERQHDTNRIQLNQYFLHLGEELLGVNPNSGLATRMQAFRSNFKYDPARCAYIFLLIHTNVQLPSGYAPIHVLWTLYFLTTYVTERRLCFILKADRKTIRKFTWPTITAIAQLSPHFVSIAVVPNATNNKTILTSAFFKICWENRLIDDNGKAVKVTVDGTDFETIEYKPFNPGRLSHKLNRPGLRYEVALSIAKCYIVHINGPFICGEWSDLRIARNFLHSRLSPREYYLADSGYRCGNGPAIMRNALPQNERNMYDKLMARHETVNRRFKEFAILREKYRHEEAKHDEIFRCIAVLVQMDIASGHVSFQV